MNFWPVQKSGLAAAPEAVRREAGWAGPAVLAVTAWLVTYSRAVMRGDDVNQFSAPYGSQIFLPNFARGWIPNRVLDLYGRNLLARVFDATFFPAHALTGVEFFQWYKIFNATLFMLFLLVVHRAVMARIAPRPGALVSVAVAFAVLLILPWTNQVRAVCYELPAFLLFLVLSEVFALLQGQRRVAPWLLPVGFVVAFSLEGYAAILLGTLAAAFWLARPWRTRTFWRGDAAVLTGLIALFCVVAIVMTLALSERAGVSESFVPFRQYAAYLKGGPVPPPDPLFYAKMLAMGGAGLAAMAVFRRRFAAACGFAAAADQHATAAQKFCHFALAAGVTSVVAALISMEANQNFFWFRAYPWGGLLITAMLFGLTAVAAFVAAAERVPLIEAGRVCIVALVISRMAVAALGQAAVANDESEKVLAGYAAALRGTTGVVATGLNLDGTEMPQRDLPSADSPDWFIAGYRAVFLKYYGVQTVAVFK